MKLERIRPETIRVIPLGGVGEIGRNSMFVEYGDDAIVIDCGVMFPDSEMLGIDLVIPDFSYVYEHSSKVRGIVITHGHEDHIGALPFVLPKLRVPVYATRLASGLIRARLEEHGLEDSSDLREIKAGQRLRLGAFELSFFHVCHSIPDGVGIAVETPIGTLVHSGDYKFDHTPVDGVPPDFQALGELGRKGVLALFGDSTYADKPGYTPSESVIYGNFDAVFAESEGRILVATFASLISRVQQVMDLAAAHGRQGAGGGRRLGEKDPQREP